MWRCSGYKRVNYSWMWNYERSLVSLLFLFYHNSIFQSVKDVIFLTCWLFCISVAVVLTYVLSHFLFLLIPINEPNKEKDFIIFYCKQNAQKDDLQSQISAEDCKWAPAQTRTPCLRWSHYTCLMFM